MIDSEEEIPPIPEGYVKLEVGDIPVYGDLMWNGKSFRTFNRDAIAAGVEVMWGEVVIREESE